MTGYGQGTAEAGSLRVSIELRSLNNRFADLRFRLPAELAGAEREVKRKVLARVRRGRVDLTLNTERLGAPEPGWMLNRPLLDELLAAGARLRDEFDLEGRLDLGTVLGVPGMLRGETVEVTWDEEQVALFGQALEAALESLDRDRRREGEHLRQELQQRLAGMQEQTGRMRSLAAAVPQKLRDRLIERLGALSGEKIQLDPARVAQEAVLLADRSDVTEEIVRLDGHLEQAMTLLGEPDGETVGKRLEFLVQEILRETNTVSSKAQEVELSRVALGLKSELEKVREQVQNLE